ncbi:unnamed protein product [Ambrosiozyma monospora]|uniref:Unnamed protein product n=1 Tax=Ambrosiozyma monospora TaxID=43982 RepID=A0A9W6YVF2_AMBMO|nr:unnamed protein product [Ambrosiozyma monospora]
MDTIGKLQTLSSRFPTLDQDALLEILIVCDGDVKLATEMLSEQIAPLSFTTVESENNISEPKKDEEAEEEYSSCLGTTKKSVDIHNETGTQSLPVETKPEPRTVQHKVQLSSKQTQQPSLRIASPIKINDIIHSRNPTKRQLSSPSTTSDETKLQRPMKKPKPTPNLTPTSKTTTLYTKQEIESTIPYIKVFPNFLPPELSDTILDELLSKTATFKHNEFYIAGTKCKSSHKTTIFIDELYKDKTYDDEFYGSDYSSVKEVGRGTDRQKHYTANLKMARFLVEDKVNELLDSMDNYDPTKLKTKASMDDYGNKPMKYPFQIQKNWKAMLCVANYFETNSQHLDWHSDKLTNIGPLPIIASLTLGATRVFRLKKTYDNNHADTTTEIEGKGPKFSNHSTIYNIPLAHNMLAIMMPGCQEEYKHCVPTLTDSLYREHKQRQLKSENGPCSGLGSLGPERAPIAGTKRFNLTFRMFHPKLANKLPTCPKCGKNMILRRMFKNAKTRGYYFWMCQTGYFGMNCDGFYYAKFDKINDFDDKSEVFTKDSRLASRWIADDDFAALKYLDDDWNGSGDVLKDEI